MHYIKSVSRIHDKTLALLTSYAGHAGQAPFLFVLPMDRLLSNTFVIVPHGLPVPASIAIAHGMMTCSFKTCGGFFQQPL